MHLIVTRPRGDSEELARLLRDQGHTVVIEPLLEIVPRDTSLPDPDRFQGLLVTSANGVRCLGSCDPAPGFYTLPVFAVGDASREAALEAGFSNVKSASGDLGALADLVSHTVDPARGPLLYPTGSKIAGDLKGLLESRGYAVERAVLYDAVARERLEAGTIEALAEHRVDGVLLFSPRTATILSDLMAKADLAAAAAAITFFCLSRPVADRLSEGLSGRQVSVQTSDTPDLAGMLTLTGPR